MLKRRIIARMDVKGDNLIKPLQMEGVRVVGDPKEYAQRYNDAGVDEILFMDAVASLYGRNNLASLVEKISENVFCPITVGGGLRNLDDVQTMLRCGADKVAVNTAAIYNPLLITEMAMKFGCQCITIQIDAKLTPEGKYEAYTDGGRQHTGLDAVDWAERAQELGAGEILVTSIDREGTRRGFDLDLIEAVTEAVTVPVVASGGFGKPFDAFEAFTAGADGVAVADGFHYGRVTVGELKAQMARSKIPMRECRA